MTRELTERGHADADDPEAIRAAMADTRAALGRKIEALRERVLGPVSAAPNQGEQAMPVKKKATKTAKKSGTAAKGKKKAAPTKKAASRKTAAKGKTAVARVTAKAKPKKAAKPAAKKKPTTS